MHISNGVMAALGTASAGIVGAVVTAYANDRLKRKTALSKDFDEVHAALTDDLKEFAFWCDRLRERKGTAQDVWESASFPNFSRYYETHRQTFVLSRDLSNAADGFRRLTRIRRDFLAGTRRPTRLEVQDAFFIAVLGLREREDLGENNKLYARYRGGSIDVYPAGG